MLNNQTVSNIALIDGIQNKPDKGYQNLPPRDYEGDESKHIDNLQ